MTETIILILAGLILGGLAGYFGRSRFLSRKQLEVEAENKHKLEKLEAKSREMLLEAKNEAFKIQGEAQREEERKRSQLEKIGERLANKEEVLDKKIESNERLKEDLERKVFRVKSLKTEIEEIYGLQKKELEKVAALSKEEAKEILLKKVEEESKSDILAQMKKAEAEVKAEAASRAKNIIADAIQRYAADTTTESTATIVTLPNDEMKGRIIGREGRNINTFEQITGIDVIVDDTPGSIVISGFDLVRRYVAKMALERLVADGRIHPARIEETVEKIKEEVNTLIKDLGEKAAYDTGVAGLHPNLVKLLGRLKFRVSYGQNVLKHSMEVAFLAASMASELGADVEICRKAGLLHDVGKAVDHEIQGHHAKIGGDILRKFGLSQEVVHAVEAHHGEPEPGSLEAILVYTANKISNTRPGATKETLDNFIKRLQEIENVSNSFEGVEKSYAIQAGREVRVIVKPEIIDDLGAIKLAQAIARKIEKDLQYPGQITVDVMRETRAEEYAK